MVLLEDAPYDVVLLDIWLPDRDGLDVLADIHRQGAAMRPEVVIISGHGTIETAVKATKLGAYDFLEKPLSLDRTLLVLKNAVEARRMRAEKPGIQAPVQRGLGAHRRKRADESPAPADSPHGATNGRVLIYGESGTGKELIAHSIHAESLRRDQIFVELNCAAIPEAHIEAELFGYRHGAQPGGLPEQRGTLERADGGTLFLDEVGDMSLKTQSKMLSALDDQQFTPVGGTQPIRVDVRLIASTNKDLEEEIAKGNFREDLFYRLNVVPFFVPPLRERKAGHTAADARVSRRIRPPVRTPAHGDSRGRPRGAGPIPLAGQRARTQECDRASPDSQSPRPAHRAQTPAAVDHKAGTRSTEEFSTLQQARDAYEREFILKKIDESRNNMSRAAELLGLERSHLYRKMKALGISVRE